MRNRLALILVDGSNAYATARQLGFQIDWKLVLEGCECEVFKAYYFTAIAPGENPVRTMVDYLVYNGWTPITKPTSEWVQDDGTKKTKGNMDIEMAVTAMAVASQVKDLTDVYMFTGDGDFTYCVEQLQRQYGLRVTVVSSILTRPPMCADSLRRQADDFLEMKTLIESIKRERRSR